MNAKPILVAMVSAKPGEEDEFNDWYVDHLREVRAVPGVVSGQRYKVGPEQAPGIADPEHANLAVYEIDGDAATVLGEIVGRRKRGEWAPRRGIDESRIGMWIFEPVSDRGEPLD